MPYISYEELAKQEKAKNTEINSENNDSLKNVSHDPQAFGEGQVNIIWGCSVMPEFSYSVLIPKVTLREKIQWKLAYWKLKIKFRFGNLYYGTRYRIYRFIRRLGE